MKAQIEALSDLLKEECVFEKFSIWQGRRIYINDFGRDITAYIEFDDPNNEDFEHLMAGTKLQVYTKAEQAGKWAINRRKQVKHEIMTALKSGGALPTDWQICATWQEIIL